MLKFEQFLQDVRVEYPELKFRAGKKFMYRPPRTIMYEKQDGSEQKWCVLQLLHELGHALSGHQDFKFDVERVRMEREAWEKARELDVNYRQKYGAEWLECYDEEYVEAAMDSYRDWLHRRSKCSKCGETRYQGSDGRYHCVFCENFGNESCTKGGF